MGDNELADIGELNILESDDTDNAGTTQEGSMESFDVDVTADFAETRKAGEFDLDVLQGSGAEVLEDGTIVADVVTVTVSEDSPDYAVVDEVVGIVTPDGTEITEERVSILGPDGEFEVLADDVAVEVEGD